jgi:uncharacterized protein (DUF305 family)
MHNKTLLGGLIGFVLGGLVVSIAAVTFDKSANQSMQDITSSLANKKGDDFDKAFLAAMIDHHQSAVDMAKLAETRAKHRDVKGLAQGIYMSQTNEIMQMQAWQQQWGYTSSKRPPHDTMTH